MSFRRYRLGGYEEMVAGHSWDVPERYNIARDVCDKHERDRLAMVWEDWRGNERRVSFGELQDPSNKFANVLEAYGVPRNTAAVSGSDGRRVATRSPRSTPTSVRPSCSRCRCSTATRASSTA